MKKIRGNEKHASIIADFREAIRECELMDLGFVGYMFTWSNRRFEVDLV